MKGEAEVVRVGVEVLDTVGDWVGCEAITVHGVVSATAS